MEALRRLRLLVVVPLLLAAVGCSSTDKTAEKAGSSSTSVGTGPAITSTTVAAAVSTTVGGTGASTTAPGATVSPPTSARVRTPIAGFGEIAYVVNGSATKRCALLAETDAQHAQGLMNRTDLGGYDGMLFVFPSNSTAQFYMKDTLIPLSIAWFDGAGHLVSTADMAPCMVANCPLYGAAGPYRYALEVTQGSLRSLGIQLGATITPGGACA